MVTIHVVSGDLVLSKYMDSDGEDEKGPETHVSDGRTTVGMYLMPQHCLLKNTSNGKFTLGLFYHNLNEWMNE